MDGQPFDLVEDRRQLEHVQPHFKQGVWQFQCRTIDPPVWSGRLQVKSPYHQPRRAVTSSPTEKKADSVLSVHRTGPDNVAETRTHAILPRKKDAPLQIRSDSKRCRPRITCNPTIVPEYMVFWSEGNAWQETLADITDPIHRNAS